jgi:hypothetical protein
MTADETIEATTDAMSSSTASPAVSAAAKAAAPHSAPAAPAGPPVSNSSRRVRFNATAAKPAPPPQLDGLADPLGMNIQRRVKLGKGSATPLRDACFLLLIVGGLLYLAANGGDATDKDKPRKKNPIALAKEMNKVQKNLEHIVMEAMETSRRKQGCGIFFAPGSIPVTGVAAFAGRRYVKGEEIYQPSLLVPLELEDGRTVQLSSLAVTLKFHPLLHNVEGQVVADVHGNLADMSLRATRPIRSGEELFLAYEQHPLFLLDLHDRNLFAHIPLAQDYTTATELEHEVATAARRMEVAHNRRVQDAIRINTGYLYMLAASVTRHFAPNVAKLLPSSRTDLETRKGRPLALAALKNQTLGHLQMSATCLADVQQQLSLVDDDDASLPATATTTVVVVTRDVTQGEVVQLVPVHMFQPRSCWGDVPCPAAAAMPAYAHCIVAPAGNLVMCPLADIALVAAATDEQKANIALQWADEKLVKKLRLQDATEAGAGTLSLNVVALQGLKSGQEVRDGIKSPWTIYRT